MVNLTSSRGGGLTKRDLTIVGLGASAGGLEALEHFFDHLHPGTAMAFVVVQHLSPDFKSLMDELLARHTTLPIHMVENGMLVEPGHVYLIPAKKEMIISSGRLLLSERDRQHELTLPIDVFFRSLAQDCGARSIAIVLSGTGSDGSRGICDVHEAGGLVLVQDLQSATVRRHAANRARYRRRRLGRLAAADACDPGESSEACRRAAQLAHRGTLANHADLGRARRRVSNARKGVRARLHALQAEHRHASDRAPLATGSCRRRAAVRRALACRASASDLRFTFDIDPRPLIIEGDAARLQQVCVNLLTNAAKYTPRGGNVVLEATREGTSAVVRVRDDGMGIPKDMLNAVFELFVQSSRTIDRAQGGIGVGLTLARSLVDMHGGTVHAASNGEGKGSLFTVRIPLSIKDIDELEVIKRGNVISTGSRMVLVEDNDDTRELMSALLTRAGFNVRAAADGFAAVTLIESFSPHAALVDVGLPGIDGFEVARRVRANSRNQGTTLIALTGYGQQSDRATAIQAGFDAHLVKPVRLEQLLAIIATHDRPSAAARSTIVEVVEPAAPIVTS